MHALYHITIISYNQYDHIKKKMEFYLYIHYEQIDMINYILHELNQQNYPKQKCLQSPFLVKRSLRS